MTCEPGRRTAVVAGGTRGIGRAVGVALARAGARVILTHRWGSADPDEIFRDFRAVGTCPPEVVEADVASADDTLRLLEHVGSGGVDILVANVCVVGRGDGTLSARTLRRSLDYSAWPLLRYMEAMTATFGASPRYVVATSSDGPDRFYPGYDYVAASKAVLEALCRRLAAEHPGSRVNALRARQVDTAGYQEMFGPEVRDVVGRFSSLDVTPQEVGGVAAALCSGDLDGLSGQVVTVDRGASPLDNLVNVAPGLLGLDRGERVPLRDTATGGRAPGILWIDAGVAPPDASLDRAVDVVPADEALALPDERIPDSVVVGCDWTGRPADDVGPATLLPELLERAGATGPYPRYGIRLDLAPDPPSPGEALARTLDRYWAGWRAPGGPSLNAVRYSDEGLRPQALSAVRALLSGGMDAVRGQVLPISCGAVS